MQKYTVEIFKVLKLHMARFCLLFACIFLLNSNIVNAASSEWQDLGGGKARLLAHLDPVTNKVSGVVEVRLDDGWSTYWRYPGSSGIPPLFDFSKSVAFTSQEVAFPAPQLITQPFGSYAGYKKKVMFPFEGELLATSGAKISLDLLIGVCSEVCIPATAKFHIDSDELLQSDPQAVQAFSFAKITVPKVADADSVLVSREQKTDGALFIKTKHKQSFGTPSLFVEGPNDWYLLPAELMSQNETTATFKLDLSRVPKDTDILSHKLRYTIVTGTKGIEIVR
jgi:DsbC/DsbD-like thiol-disulfide interchange protein